MRQPRSSQASPATTRDDDERRREEQRRLHAADDRVDDGGDGAEQRMEVGVEPVDGGGEPGAGGEDGCQASFPVRMRFWVRRSITMVRMTMAMAASIDLAMSRVRIAS